MTQKTNQNPWQLDVRTRERNLKSGALTEKDLEKFLASLPDLESTTEPFGTSQPALEQPKHVAAAVADDDDDDDLDDDADDESSDDVAADAPAGEAVVNDEGEQP